MIIKAIHSGSFNDAITILDDIYRLPKDLLIINRQKDIFKDDASVTYEDTVSNINSFITYIMEYKEILKEFPKNTNNNNVYSQNIMITYDAVYRFKVEAPYDKTSKKYRFYIKEDTSEYNMEYIDIVFKDDVLHFAETAVSTGSLFFIKRIDSVFKSYIKKVYIGYDLSDKEINSQFDFFNDVIYTNLIFSNIKFKKDSDGYLTCNFKEVLRKYKVVSYIDNLKNITQLESFKKEQKISTDDIRLLKIIINGYDIKEFMSLNNKDYLLLIYERLFPKKLTKEDSQYIKNIQDDLSKTPNFNVSYKQLYDKVSDIEGNLMKWYNEKYINNVILSDNLMYMKNLYLSTRDISENTDNDVVYNIYNTFIDTSINASQQNNVLYKNAGQIESYGSYKNIRRSLEEYIEIVT